VIDEVELLVAIWRSRASKIEGFPNQGRFGCVDDAQRNPLVDEEMIAALHRLICNQKERHVSMAAAGGASGRKAFHLIHQHWDSNAHRVS
jgi:hypothetical protein